MPKLLALWKRLTDSLWFLPAVLTTTGAALALLLVRADPLVLGDGTADEVTWLFSGSADSAHGILGAIGGSLITVTGVVFSVTIVALQLASQQFTPRVLRQFMSDRANQWVLGVFIGTFTYTLVVQRTVRGGDGSSDAFIPVIAVSAAVALALLNIGFLIFFIDHAARSIQADVIMARVTHETLASFPRVAEADARDVSDSVDTGVPPTEPVSIAAERAGYIQGLDEDRLTELAAEHGMLVRVDRRTGSFIMPGVSLLSVWGGALTDRVAAALRGAFVVGDTRTPHQDPELGVIELVDIALKALSPGINDPTTAMHAIERLGQVICAVGTGRRAARARRDRSGEIRVILPPVEFEHVAGMAFDQIRHYGVSNPSVAVKLLHTLGEVAGLLREPERGVILDIVRHTAATAEAQVSDAGDLERVRRAATGALLAARDT